MGCTYSAEAPQEAAAAPLPSASASSIKKHIPEVNTYETAKEKSKDIYKVRRPAAERFVNENLQYCNKYVPDCLLPSRLQSNGSCATMYFYAVRAIAADEISHRVLSSCESCNANVKALNQICIAVPSLLPEDIARVVSELVFREMEVINFHVQYIGCFEVERETTLRHMQRFHRAVCCWQNEMPVEETSSSSSSSSAGRWKREITSPLCANSSKGASVKELFDALDSGYKNIYSLDEGAGSVREEVPLFVSGTDIAKEDPFSPYVDAEEWARSSNGAYYVVLPLPEDSPQVISNKRELLLSPEQLDIFRDPLRLQRHVRDCANDAQALVYNLQVLRRANRERRLHFFPPSETRASADELRGQLLSRGTLDLFMALDGQGDKVRLGSVLKTVTTAAPVDENGNRGAKSTVSVTYGENFASRHPHWRGALESLAGRPEHCLVSVLSVATKCKLIPLLKTRAIPTNLRFDSVRLDMQKRVLLGRNEANGYTPDDGLFYDKNDLNSPLLDLASYGLRDECYDCGPLPFKQTLGRSKASNEQRAKTNVAKKNKEFSRYHKHNSPAFLVPECCRPLGRSVWMHMGLCLPSIMWRLQSLLVAAECRDSIAPPGGLLSTLPDSKVVLEAITPVRVNEEINSERLENLGDTLLKFVSAVVLYNRFPLDTERALSNKRSDIICNKNLCEISQRIDIAKYVRCVNLSTGKQSLRIRPPGMVIGSTRQAQSLWNVDILEVKAEDFSQQQAAAKKAKKKTTVEEEEEAEEEQLLMELNAVERGDCADAAAYFKSLYPHAQCAPVLLREKAMADAVEAVIGAFLASGGVGAGLESVFAFGILDREAAGANPLVVPKGTVTTPAIMSKSSDPGDVLNHFDSATIADVMEEKIGYRFKDIVLLQLAFTQSSDLTNVVTHQRLEFLGDAILDFVVISILFEQQRWARQGDLHGQKAQATNNDRLAAVAIKLKLYKYLYSSNGELKEAFKRLDARINDGLLSGDANGLFKIRDSTNLEYTVDLARASPGLKVNEATVSITVVDNAHKQESMNISYVTNQDVKLYDLPEKSRKVLADTLESVIAAVYIDSGSDLAVVASVVHFLDMLPQV